jgi:signal transduction histidine kinase
MIRRTVDGLRERWLARSLRFELAAIIALVGLFLIALNAAVLGVFLNRYVVERDGTALGQQASALSRCSSDGVLVALFSGQRTAGGMLQAALGSPEDHHAVVVNSSGVVLYVTPMAPSLQSLLLIRLRRDLAQGQLTPAVAPAWHELNNEIVVDTAFICRAGSNQVHSPAHADLHGALLVAEDRRVAERAWRHLLGYVVVAGLAVTAVGAITGLVAGDALTRSIRAVTRVARAIAAGDFGRRVSAHGPAEITEMSAAFNQMVEEVVRQRRIERDLLANISHELASPLGLIRGYAEALVDDVFNTGPERSAALQAIQQETARLERLTADLLDLALLETGQVSVQVEEVPVGELLNGLRERLAPIMRRSGVTLSVETSSNLPPLMTDGQRLEQVLVNLLSNALRYTPAGGTIVMAAARDGNGLRITVADSGTGIPPEELPRIWERFYRVEKGRDRREHEAHVGLGLAICHSTITLLEGTIEVQSTPGVGTTFAIWIPFHAEQRPRSSSA